MSSAKGAARELSKAISDWQKRVQKQAESQAAKRKAAATEQAGKRQKVGHPIFETGPALAMP
eukprot:1850078-Lingulodinium_polyedra.AAC.1